MTAPPVNAKPYRDKKPLELTGQGGKPDHNADAAPVPVLHWAWLSAMSRRT